MFKQSKHQEALPTRERPSFEVSRLDEMTLEEWIVKPPISGTILHLESMIRRTMGMGDGGDVSFSFSVGRERVPTERICGGWVGVTEARTG